MAGAVVGGAALGFALTVVYEGGKCIYRVFNSCDLKELDETLTGLLPIIDKIGEVRLESRSDAGVPKLQEFREKLEKAQNRESTLNPFKKIGEAKHIKKAEKEINKFMQNEVLPNVLLNTLKLLNCSQDMKNSLLNCSQDMKNSFSTQLETLRELIRDLISEQETRFNNLASKIDVQHTDSAGQIFEISEEDRNLCRPPDRLSCFMGFKEDVMELKKHVLEGGVDVVGVTAMGGAGKSTLATELCHDPDIKEFFKKRLIYLLVSQSPDRSDFLKTMWKNIVGSEPHFTNDEDAHNKLQSHIKSIKNEPTLVVLDDIWHISDLEILLFQGEQYRTVVTTRDKHIIQSISPGINYCLYPLPSLQEDDALSLFCRCAFGISTIPDTHSEQLVKQVQAGCKGLPLALQVIGRSLKGAPNYVWNATRDALARGEASDDDQIEDLLIKRLKTSIDVLNENEQQCFLDLAVFPKGQIIPANTLLDIWVYARPMKPHKAVLCLQKFADRHLLDLKRDPWNSGMTDDCMNSYSFSQHDVMRDLALYLANEDNQCMRLYMPKMENHFPSEWQTDRDLSSKAQIVSIHTGAMKNTEWPEMEFPEAEALVLYFTASEYCIPKFLNSMGKLKVLIIHNDRAKRAKLSGLAAFQELSQLKTLHLERVIVPPLHVDCKGLKSLQKIYLSLCEGLGKDKMFNLPALLEFNVDHCSDLEELSAGICSSNSLEMLSITHCHRLAKLPDDLGKLGSLKEIRLCQSPELKALPPSICRLAKLELLNISSCMGLKVDRRKRPELKKTLQQLAKLASLRTVICDEENEQLFRNNSKAGLKVVPVEEEFNLNWLFR